MRLKRAPEGSEIFFYSNHAPVYFCLFFVKTDFLEALRNTAAYTAAVLFFSLLLAAFFAICLGRDSWLNRFLQKSMFTTYLISSVSCACIWSWIYNADSGILNAMLSLLGLPLSRWLNDSDLARFCAAAGAVLPGILMILT